MTCWDTDNLNAAHTAREINEIEVSTKPVDGMTYDICEAAVPMSDYRALQAELSAEKALADRLYEAMKLYLIDEISIRNVKAVGAILAHGKVRGL